jgi:hypothetical protein
MHTLTIIIKTNLTKMYGWEINIDNYILIKHTRIGIEIVTCTACQNNWYKNIIMRIIHNITAKWQNVQRQI